MDNFRACNCSYCQPGLDHWRFSRRWARVAGRIAVALAMLAALLAVLSWTLI
jgi:hypothetical protein